MVDSSSQDAEIKVTPQEVEEKEEEEVGEEMGNDFGYYRQVLLLCGNKSLICFKEGIFCTSHLIL